MYPRNLGAIAVAVMLTILTAGGPASADEGDNHNGSAFVNGNTAGYELEGVEQLGGVVQGPGVPGLASGVQVR